MRAEAGCSGAIATGTRLKSTLKPRMALLDADLRVELASSGLKDRIRLSIGLPWRARFWL